MIALAIPAINPYPFQSKESIECALPVLTTGAKGAVGTRISRYRAQGVDQVATPGLSLHRKASKSILRLDNNLPWEWAIASCCIPRKLRTRQGSSPPQWNLPRKLSLSNSFWEAPEEIENGYMRFGEFYRHNYLRHIPADHNSRILVISCGAGYFVKLLSEQGYPKVLGINSFESKVAHGRRHGLDCREARAFPFLATSEQTFDAIICEQELNHLTKQEMQVFLRLVYQNLSPGGTLIVHSLNGANPITGAEALAQNIDHFNTMTEYSLRQVLQHAGFEHIYVFPLNLYVFYKNPANYVAWGIATLFSVLFRACFMLYGKSNRIFTKKIGASCRKPA